MNRPDSIPYLSTKANVLVTTHYKECHSKTFKRVCRKVVPENAKQRTLQQWVRKTEIFQKLSRFRNRVETIPSNLRRKYGVNHIPVRGLIRSKFILENKIATLNFKKFCKSMQGIGLCAYYAVNA